MSATELVIASLLKETTGSPLEDIFVEQLGWDFGNGVFDSTSVEGISFTLSTSAQLSGFHIIKASSDVRPASSVMQAIDKEMGRRFPERLVVFDYPGGQQWRWPKKLAGSGASNETVEVGAGPIPLFMAQRLASLQVTVANRRGLTIGRVRDMVAGQFDTAKVTKKFYDKFRRCHRDLAESMTGLDSEVEAAEYSSVVLNRLMFLYFFEKKGFLNGDVNYLRTCMSRLEQLKGSGRFYEFYRDLLLPICFLGLNRNERPIDDDLADIIGDVPYVNGGIFAEQEIERRNDIRIPDSAFVDVFDLFDGFTWHLDTRPGGNDNEINPDVLGYIFEQYINFTSTGKKEGGAYYTPTDVSSYMTNQTVTLRILDIAVELGLEPLNRLSVEPLRYLLPSQMHGFDWTADEWIPAPAEARAAWLAGPTEWYYLDNLDHAEELCLPDESWVEMFHRRDLSLASQLRMTKGEVTQVSDLLTYNLNSDLLLLDTIEGIKNSKLLDSLWRRLSELSVLDPTCGSGAFLFAAMELLEGYYAAIVRVAEELRESGSKSEVAELINGHHNLRYFVRKHIALNNLYGSDLMGEAVETAKLRIFLALVACLESRTELEPLPDLDFNLKVGNLVVGIARPDDVLKLGGDLFNMEALESLQPRVDAYAAMYSEFVTANQAGSNTSKLRVEMSAALEELRNGADGVLQSCYIAAGIPTEVWRESVKPLHWFIEFPSVMARGGFDVIVGNPPYIKRSELNPLTRLLTSTYVTSDCPDFYAICYERSLELLNSVGRHAFIVMLSISCSDSFEALRKVVAAREGGEWWSTYAKRPDSLFRGVGVRNTILVLGKGTSSYSTRHMLFSKESRGHLFASIEYHEALRSGASLCIRAGGANSVVNSALQFHSKRTRLSNLVHRGVGQYWFPILPSRPPIINYADLSPTGEIDRVVKKVEIPEGVSENIMLALLGGKIGYLLWSSTSDDFNCTGRVVELAANLAVQIPSHATEDLERIATRIRSVLRNHVFVSQNKDGYINIRWNAMRDATDSFDELLLTSLSIESLWAPLNVWYRQVMRSSSENSNSKMLGKNAAIELTGW